VKLRARPVRESVFMLKIRPFIEGKDEPVHIDIMNRAMKEFPDFTPMTLADATMEENAPTFDRQGRFIAERNDESVGYVHAYLDPKREDRQGFLEGPFVIPVYRRKHIGGALIKTALNNFQERGIKKVEGLTRANSIAGQKLLESFAFTLHRMFSRMKRSLENLPVNVGENKGIKIIDLSNTDASIKIGVELTNEAFNEHYNFRPNTYEEIEYYYGEQKKLGVHFNNFVAYSSDVPVGIMITAIDPREFEHYKKRTSLLAVLGVLKPYRSKGIGKALMIHAMKFLRDKGMEEARLFVDDTNITKAIKIYESLGFEVSLKYFRFIKEI
jgi:ribosomal protein S18 acetylase RimI-like enzyme